MLTTAVDRTQTSGDGAETEFPYLFKIWLNSEIEVIRSNKVEPLSKDTLTLGVDYTVEDVGQLAGGTITLIGAQAASPPETSENITCLRKLAYTQAVAVTNQGGFKGNMHERKFDWITALIQQLKGAVDRCFQVDEVSMADTADLTYEDMLARSPVLLDETIVSAVSECVVYSADAEDYDQLKLEILGLHGSDVAVPRMYFTDVSGTAYSTHDFPHTGVGHDVGSNEIWWSSASGVAYAELADSDVMNNSSVGMYGDLILARGANGLYSTFRGQVSYFDGLSETVAMVHGTLAGPTGTAVLGGVQLYMSTGTITGTARLWGMPNGS